MFLGACVDAGLPWEKLTEAVSLLGLEGVTVEQLRRRRGSLSGLRFRVLEDGKPIEGPDPDEGEEERHHGHQKGHEHGPHRSLEDIRRLIEGSGLDEAIKHRSQSFFSRLATVEAKVHGVERSEVHFHEVGAIDAIVDLVGAAVALEHFQPSSVSCGSVNVGTGIVRTAHGELPVPAPATAELLTGVRVYGSGQGELLTPTGAVILAESVDSFDGLPEMELQSTGYGLGRREVPGRANAFRLLVGRVKALGSAVWVLESQIDDLTGEGFGFLMERLSASAALDVFFTSVQMKKNRPGTLVTVLCREEDLEGLATKLLGDSGSLGCRYYPVDRFEAERSFLDVDTEYGSVKVKEGRFRGRRIAQSPEFEDCRRRAKEHSVTWQEVHRAALAALRG